MTAPVTYVGSNSVHLAGRAFLLDGADREMAWAEKHVRADKNLKWILGNYVMADQANSNGHIFPLEDLKTYGQATIPNKPLNMLHIPDRIVGHYAAVEMLYPMGASEEVSSPYIQALAAYYYYYFEDTYREIEKAHREGQLFFSMESVPASLVCAAEGCGLEFAYAGRQHESYCAHLQEPIAARQLKQPHFTGGALIIPPVRPGWKSADIHELSRVFEEAETTYNQVVAAAPHLDPRNWELIMLTLISRDISAPERKRLSEQKKALPNGSFPIANAQDLRNAIQAIGRAKDPAKAKAHIKRAAKRLGLENLIPDSWE